MPAEDLLGSWRLESFEQVSAVGEHLLPLGENPSGLLSYTPDGMMSVHLLASRGSDEVAMPDYTGYFGTYTVAQDRQVIGHHIEAASEPGLVGTTQERQYSLVEGKLTLSASFEGSAYLLVWSRERR